MVGVIVLRYVFLFGSGELVPRDAVYMDWALLSTWFFLGAVIDLVCVTLLLQVKSAKFLIASMYLSFVWSIILAIEASLSSEYLIQFDRVAQIAIFIALMAALVAGVMECRESRPQSSSSRS